MKINTKAKNIELSTNITEYLEEKLSMLGKHLDESGDQEVLFSVEVGKTTEHHQTGDHLYRAEINLNHSGSYERTVAEEQNLFAAIDKAKDEMERILSRKNDRNISRIKKGGRKIKNMLRGLRW